MVMLHIGIYAAKQTTNGVKMEIKTYIYNSIFEYLFFLRKNDFNEKTMLKNSFAFNDTGKFYGTRYSEIISLQHKRLMAKKEKIENVNNLNILVETNYKSMCENGIIAHEYNRNVTGDFYDIGDVISGVPECWFEYQNNCNSGNLNIVAQSSFSCAYSKEKIIKNGLDLLSIVMTLKSSRISYNFWLVDSTLYEGTLYQDIINVTDIDNIDCLLTVLCSPAFCRRLSFRALEIHTLKEKCGGYGSAVNPNFDYFPIANEDVIYCKFGDNHVENVTNILLGNTTNYNTSKTSKNSTIYYTP